ncbi:MAG: glycerol kinase, partial [Spirochaetales bacterium]|nr:glycerol kinase [Spirochaetales bacterium]
MRYAFGIDVGTTGIKAVIANSDGQALAYESAEQKQYFPRPGWCEQNPDEILRLCLDIYSRLLEKTGLRPRDISCIGLDHQGESCLVWDKNTGRPVYPVITWQDRRMAAVSDEFGKQYGDRIRTLTGLRSDSY